MAPPSKSPLAGEGGGRFGGWGIFILFFYKDKSCNLLKFVLVLLSASVERVGVSRMRNFFIKGSAEKKPVWTSLLILCQKSRKNNSARKRIFLCPQNSYIGHKGDKWKIKGKPIPFFIKVLCWCDVLLKHCKGFKLKVKSPFFVFVLQSNRFFGLRQDLIFSKLFNTILYLLDLFGFGPNFFFFLILENFHLQESEIRLTVPVSPLLELILLACW